MKLTGRVIETNVKVAQRIIEVTLRVSDEADNVLETRTVHVPFRGTKEATEEILSKGIKDAIREVAKKHEESGLADISSIDRTGDEISVDTAQDEHPPAPTPILFSGTGTGK